MDSFFVLLLIIGLVVPVGAILGIIAFADQGKAKRRMLELEAKVGALENYAYLQGLEIARLQGIAVPGPATPAAKVPAKAAPAPVWSGYPDVIEPLAWPVEAPRAAAAASAVPRVAAPAAPPPAPADFESAFGSRWAVWIGGLALGLGGIFLVAYSIEQGLIGPEMRVVLGTLLGLGLLGAGEMLFRRGFSAPIAGLRNADVPSILTAAGAATLFGVTFAAHALFGLIGPTAAFLALVVVALTTILLALRHAPWLSALGLAAGYVAPLLIGSTEPSPWPVVGLATVLSTAAFALARFCGWVWLAVIAVVGHLAWALPMISYSLSEPWRVAAATHLAVFIGLVLAFALARTQFANVPNTATRGAFLVSVGGAAAGGFFVLLLTLATRSADLALILAVTTVAALTASAIHPRLKRNLLTAAILATGVIAAFDVVPAIPQWFEPRQAPVFVDRSIDVAFWVAGAFALIFLAGGAHALRVRRDAMLSLAAAAMPVVLLAALTLRFRLVDMNFAFGLVALALAALNTAIAEALDRMDPTGRGALAAPAGFHAAGAAAALGLGLALLMPGTQLTLGFALGTLGIAFVWTRRPYPALLVAIAAGAAAALVALYWNPTFLRSPLHGSPILNMWAIVLGLPALALAATAWIIGRDRRNLVQSIVEAGASFLGLLWVCIATWQALFWINPNMLGGYGTFGLGVAVLAVAHLGLRRLAEATTSPIYRVAAWAALVLAGLVVLVLLFGHPWTGAVGGGAPRGSIVNGLITDYLLPTLVAAGLGYMSWKRDGRHSAEVKAFEIGAHVLLAAYILGAINVYFGRPGRVGWEGAELWAYSIAGLAYAIGLLVAGLMLARRDLRLASAVLLVVVTVKVFVFDLAGLTGLWRALSFIGLGIVLIGIGLLYQRLLVKAPARPAPPTPPVSRS